MVDAPNVSFETGAGVLKSRVREEVNVKSVGFGGGGVSDVFMGDVDVDADADAGGVSRDLVGRWVTLGELTREGYATVDGLRVSISSLR